MNFFQLQDDARRKTGLLIVYFVLAVVSIILAINAVAFIAATQTMDPPPGLSQWIASRYWVVIALGTLAIIGFGTLKTTYSLSGGGGAVADMVGARRIQTDTGNADERRLLNVVEEMSIASGTPVPDLYVMDSEPAINAFVAGFRPTASVLVVTRGALETLDRDELQGVIGHEYSHILNGDMRINLRLMCILAGILLIGQIGRVLLRSTGRGSGKSGNQAALFGLALFIIGYIGLFFGALIKAAISRQRELLADASSVQFTRNPAGIAGALWKIKESTEGSLLSNSHADDLSHLCFGDSVTYSLTSLMATHPPLEQRINAVYPGYLLQAKAERAVRNMQAGSPAPAARPIPAAAAGFAGGAAAAGSLSGARLADSVGTVTPEHVKYAAEVHAALPAALVETLHKPQGARDAIYALLLSAVDPSHRSRGVDVIRQMEGADAPGAIDALTSAVRGLEARQRLPVVNLAIHSLKSLDPDARRRFLEVTEKVIQVDGRYTVFEFAVLAILRQHLGDGAGVDNSPRYFKYEPVLARIRVVLSVLARVGAQSEEQVRRAYSPVMAQFTREMPEPLPAAECTLAALNGALHELNLLAPLLKRSVIGACADCVIEDGRVLPGEAQLLEALAVTLDCPLPPVLATAS